MICFGVLAIILKHSECNSALHSITLRHCGYQLNEQLSITLLGLNIPSTHYNITISKRKKKINITNDCMARATFKNTVIRFKQELKVRKRDYEIR